MATPASILQLFTSFIPGFRLIDGGQLKTLADLRYSVAAALTASLTSTQAGATPLTAACNVVTTSTNSGVDAVILPFAIPGAEAWLENRTANTIKVFGQAKNPANANAGDTIIPSTSVTPAATGTGVTQATTILAVYKCATMGVWKQGKLT